MQSIENVIKTDLIHTALSVAGAHLKTLGRVNSGPHSELGLIERAKAQRAKELDYRWPLGDRGPR